MGTRHHAPDMFTRVMQFVWDMFETALNLGDGQTVTDCLILCTRWRQSTCHLTGLARSPLRANHSKPPAASAAGGRLSTGSQQSIGF